MRQLLQSAVGDIEPREGALQHLRRAVPARAARRRQALVGAVAAAVLIGTAVPALVHVSRAPGSSNEHTSIAGHGEDAHGGTSQGQNPDGGGTDPTPTPSESKPPGGKDDGKKEEGDTEGPGEESSSPEPDGTMAASAPSCGIAELGNATTALGAPDASGAVYGTFRVVNVSGGNCTVDGVGGVTAAAQGAADPARIGVVDHTAGDAATGLPDPSLEVAQLVLQPGMAYEVKFAWVPSEGCTTPGGGEPSAEPTPTETPATTDQTGVSPQLVTEDGDPAASGSVTVSHVADPGAPSTGTTIENACAGTVYRTGILAGS
ncbi:hypothetical protein HUT18_14645 [Streptomyces sp. NA04227]|nr:hypothetical protein HUT18_14645 [Streptomyces sp. NA04227]